MQALRINRFGPPDVIESERVAVPEPGPGEVVIAVAYCGICRHDLLTRAGAFPSIDLPVTLGHQVSGTVVATGEGVRSVAAGDRVMTMIYRGCGSCENCRAGDAARCLTRRPDFLGEDFDGGYAEYVAVPAEMVLGVPEAVGLDAAAVITCTFGTAYHALVARGRLEAGETLLVTGASGGVGIHAVQLAKSLGARVVAVTSSDSKVALVRDAGADEVIVAPDQRFSREAKGLTGGAGVDAVLEIVGSRTLGQSVRSLRDGGRVVVLGNVDGRAAELSPALLILKEIALVGTKSCSREELERVIEMIGRGDLELAGVTRVALGDAVEAHRLMESGGARGRVVLEVAGEPDAPPA